MKQYFFILTIFSTALFSSETLFVKTEGLCEIDVPTCRTYSINKISSDGTVTSLQEFEFSGITQGESFVNEYEGKFYVAGPSSYAVYDIKSNTITFEERPEGSIVQRPNGWNGEDVISQEANGEIHIGENSLVTVEQDGKQQLYATDANGNQIDINIKKGSDLLVDGKSVSQAITDVATNKTNIATNTSNIATNTQAINSLGTRVDGLTSLVNTFDQRITDLQTLTGTMMSEYRSGIASSVALSQIRYASKGFSIGVGQGEFKDKDEMAFGIGYGGEFNDRVGYQFQFGSSGDTSGFGFTITF
tara:strand:- start:133 stop:1041 length:909 start_codon:yes stop_codon:yes gene_type:complete